MRREKEGEGFEVMSGDSCGKRVHRTHHFEECFVCRRLMHDTLMVLYEHSKKGRALFEIHGMQSVSVPNHFV